MKLKVLVNSINMILVLCILINHNQDTISQKLHNEYIEIAAFIPINSEYYRQMILIADSSIYQ